jgi:hypothetical protein
VLPKIRRIKEEGREKERRIKRITSRAESEGRTGTKRKEGGEGTYSCHRQRWF